MAETKTKATPVSVDDFLAAVPNERRREDALTLRAMLDRLTGDPATMWGPSMIGYGTYHYRYDSGHEGNAFRLGFSPRSANLVLYLASDYPGHDAQLARLGKHKTSKACLYINRLSDIDQSVLEEMIRDTIAHMDERYPRQA